MCIYHHMYIVVYIILYNYIYINNVCNYQ
jgi:hypothetical protein